MNAQENPVHLFVSIHPQLPLTQAVGFSTERATSEHSTIILN